jgi:hypothetical protein
LRAEGKKEKKKKKRKKKERNEGGVLTVRFESKKKGRGDVCLVGEK